MGYTRPILNTTQAALLDALLNPTSRIVQQVAIPDPNYETVLISDYHGVINFQATCGQGFRLVVPDAIASISKFTFSVQLAPGTTYGKIDIYNDGGGAAPGTPLFSIEDDPADTDDVLAQITISNGTYFVNYEVLSK